MQAGNCQQVNRARFHKGLGPIVLQPLAFTQQDRRRQTGSIMVQIAPQDPAAGSPNPRQPGAGVPAAGPGQRYHAIGMGRADEAELSAGAAIAGEIEFAGVVGRWRAGESTVDLQLVAGAGSQQMALDQQGRQAGRLTPAGAVANGVYLQHHAAPLVGRDRPQGVVLGCGDLFGHFGCAATDADRPRHGAGIASQLVD